MFSLFRYHENLIYCLKHVHIKVPSGASKKSKKRQCSREQSHGLRMGERFDLLIWHSGTLSVVHVYLGFW